VLVLAVAACTPGPGPERPERPHPYFPIGAGTPHAAVGCESCHPPSGTTFAEFQCLSCHPEARHPQVARFQYESRACFGCHGPGAFASDPTQNLTITAQVPSFSGTVIDEVAPAEQTLPMTMNHGSPGIPRIASACASCHRDFALGLFYGGQFHATLLDLNAPPAQLCADCHWTAMPFGFVGPPKGPPRAPPTGSMRHDGLTVDCGVCHTAPTTASAGLWSTNASFHAALDRAAIAQPASCLGCHANARPGVVQRPGLRQFNHRGDVWLGDCATCHAVNQPWSDGAFHASAGRPASCLPCHEQRRPTDAGMFSGPLNRPAPFDYVGNALGISHGGGQDCAVCHQRTSNGFDGGYYAHGAGTLADRTCVVCHSTQRPADVTHVQSGDCFGCHQASNATAHATMADWAGGRGYPDDVLVSSSDRFIKVQSFELRRSPAGLVTAAVPSEVTLFNAMLHSSTQVPPALRPVMQPADCLRCHAPNTFLDAGFHAPVRAFDAGQPASCLDCHAKMSPPGIVKQTDLRPMNHSVDAGITDCVQCHAGPFAGWDGGAGFHSRGASASDCVSCHFTLMASPQAAVDASPRFSMKHLSPQVTVQQCSTCHPTANMAQVSVTSWQLGNLHDNLNPTACVDCHAVSRPAPRRSMNHGDPVVFAKDCAFCHEGERFDGGAKLHRSGIAPAACAGCHRGDVPDAGFETDVITSASPATGRSGVRVQITHTQPDVAARDCAVCHAAPGTDGGTTFNGAKLHLHFAGGTALTGRCSACHFNLKPVPSYPGHDHSAYLEASGTDCRACHAWPGTGTAASPNWHAPAALAPATMSVGGFSIARPPAPDAGIIQAGLSGLQHPAVPAGGSCTSCHTQATGGRNAFAYDHALAPSTGCNACHEAGSDLVATPFSVGTGTVAAVCSFGGGMVQAGAGDTRPVGLSALPCAPSATPATITNHFYPADCGECHRKPAGAPATTSTGATYQNAWRFQHSFGAPIQGATCCGCHAPPSCRG